MAARVEQSVCTSRGLHVLEFRVASLMSMYLLYAMVQGPFIKVEDNALRTYVVNYLGTERGEIWNLGKQ